MSTVTVEITRKPLKLSGDTKVSPLMKLKPSGGATVKVRNAFGTTPGAKTCAAGMTPFCEDCYACTVASFRPNVLAVLDHNADELIACGDDVDAIASLLGAVVDGFRREAERHGTPLVFRPYWSGDVHNAACAVAWSRVMTANPDVTFWQYTRAFPFVQHLANVENLNLYLSVDAWNVDAAREVLDAFPHLRVALCGRTQEEAVALGEKLDRTPAPCPENVGRIPLMCGMSGRRSDVPTGGDLAQGACVACGLCVYGRRDVGFSTSKR